MFLAVGNPGTACRSASPAQNRPQHPAQNLVAQPATDAAGHAAGGALGGGLDDAFAAAAARASAAAEQVAEAVENAAAGFLRGRSALPWLRSRALRRLLAGMVAPIIGIEAAAAGWRGGNGAGRRTGGGWLSMVRIWTLEVWVRNNLPESK